MPAFRSMTPGESLDHFHQRCVVPEPGEVERRNAEIDSFVRFLHGQFSNKPYTVDRVVKSGSLGKGTAVRGNADIDLVVVFNGLNSIEDLRDRRPYLLDTLEKGVSNYAPWRGRVTRNDRTNYSCCYILNGQEIDILPALNVLGVYGNIQTIYTHINSPRAAQEFSASLAPMQIEFVKPQDESVKRVIRLLKYWKKENSLDIRSYTLELLTIHADRSTSASSTLQLFRRVLEMLQDCANLRVAFNDNYTNSRGRPSNGYVMDPANPFMNTLHGVSAVNVSYRAGIMLRSL